MSRIGQFLPGFLSPWIDAFANRPGWFLIGVIAIALLLRKSTSLQVAIHDGMRDLWAGSLGMVGPSHSPKPRVEEISAGWIYRLRTNAAYQAILQILKWRAVPNVFGLAILAIGLLGGLALMLTLSGLFSVLSYLVEQRTREIGLRMALGASPRTVTQLVLGQTTRPVMAGLIAGAALAAALATAVLATPFGALISHIVHVTDPVAYLASLGLIVAVCLLAAWIPAARAAKVDPMRTLRQT